MESSTLNKLSPMGREQVILLEGKLREIHEKLVADEYFLKQIYNESFL